METTERPPWATELGLPSAHILRAALHAGRLIDSQGSAADAVDLAYVIYPSDGLFPPPDLRVGLDLLVDSGLVAREDDLVRPLPGLFEIVALPSTDAAASLLVLVFGHLGTRTFDEAVRRGILELARNLGVDAERREALLLALARRHDDLANVAIGALGEDFVVEQAKSELIALGLHDLVAGVRRVSLVTDALGYDVVAPSVHGMRRLEVKTSRMSSPGLFAFYLSRPEFEWGQRDAEWALVGCRLDGDALTVVGWCRAQALTAYLPADGASGRWEAARVVLPEATLQPGLPSAI